MNMKNKTERLSEVFKASPRIPLDDQSRYVFFSDVHRGDNSWADEFAHNKAIYQYALDHYLHSGYTYVEVGDGDELLKTHSFENIHIAHREVFITLNRFYKAGRYLYIFGNHDREISFPGPSRKNMQLLHNRKSGVLEPIFRDIPIHEGLVFDYHPTGGKLFVTHGHQGELFNDHFWLVSRFLVRYIWRPLQLLGIQDPTRVATNPRKRERVERELIAWVQTSGTPLLSGHTHIPSFPQNDAPAYFNAGSCVHPRWITCVEIIDGSILLAKWHIKTKRDGSLLVQREITGGPAQLSTHLETPIHNSPDGNFLVKEGKPDKIRARIYDPE
jgi:UDP-2,3-diacylglucosamine pyrophosphatase LpxH